MKFAGFELLCPHCRSDLHPQPLDEERLQCEGCHREFPIILGIPDLRIFPDPYIGVEEDREKALLLGDHWDELNFRELLDFYYEHTEVVPTVHRQQYIQGVLAGVPRAKARLEAWEAANAGRRADSSASLLEVGCGTAPLMVAASPRFDRIAGVDIALRWLVVAKKRLEQEGVEAALFCACAEALPFPNRSFDVIAAESALEHFRSQDTALSECHRVLEPAGYLYLASPNRYSLGPDPQAGIWAGGYLPESLVARIVKWQGGIPPKRSLPSWATLTDRLRRTHFRVLARLLPDVPEAQRAEYGFLVNAAVGLYQLVKKSPILRHLMIAVGPYLMTVAQKPAERS